MLRSLLRISASALLLALGCQGVFSEPGTPGSNSETVERERRRMAVQVQGTDHIRRLSPTEVEQTIRDLFEELGVIGGEAPPPIAPPDVRYQFSNTVNSGNFTPTQVSNLMTWSEGLSQVATEDLTSLLGCAPAGWDDCSRGFAERLGRLAFRRPLNGEELAVFEIVYVTVAAEVDARAAVRALFELALQSPDFWYLVPDTRENSTSLTSHAIASRLSYFLWGTMPDEGLRAIADQDGLETPEEIRAQAAAMLDDPRADEILVRFHHEWLHLSDANSLDKDPTIYPNFTAETAAELEVEFAGYVRNIVRGGGSVEDLLSGRYGYVNRPLEELVGVAPTSSGPDDWQWRELGPERAGLLTRPLFLASTAGTGESALIHRGVAVIEKMLCGVLVAPNDVSDEAVEIPVGATSGKLAGVENRASKPRCRTCHTTIDPIGLAFESFDAIGGFRTEYPDGVAIETEGRIERGLVPSEVQYTDAASLMGSLAQMPEVQRCYAGKWLEWTIGRSPTAEEAEEVARIAAVGEQSIRELLVELASSQILLTSVEVSR
ncbi:MAG: DUF1592 domain-containing protein [Myxococcota bacterium]